MTDTCPEFPHFGATYPDARCIDGYLWDLDSCEVPGGPLYAGGDDPCPFCNREAAVKFLADVFLHQQRFGSRCERVKEARKQLKKFCAQVLEEAGNG